MLTSQHPIDKVLITSSMVAKQAMDKTAKFANNNYLKRLSKKSILVNLTVEIESSKAALNDPIYIFIDLIDGHYAKGRIGVRVAIAAGLIDNTPNFIELYCLIM
ncbi:6294_t:CDS:2 [Funneliformis mosseae]|uniref:6294_t:CDS:1 n=1 Tax=Funneliformis mosseae TaxID=27381 RepID=A0A9N8ZUG2_FUNMO|nr:6294_t:CDS:2 [Funneliformis mosseae]